MQGLVPGSAPGGRKVAVWASRAAALSLALTGLACAGDDQVEPAPDAGIVSTGIGPIDAGIYDWRSEPCEPFEGGFTEPVLDPAEGPVQLSLSSTMQPVGYDTRVELRVVRVGTDMRDTDLAGNFELLKDDAVEEVSREPLAEGRGAVVVRFTTPGRHVLRVRALDGSGREGTVTVFVYRTQLQVWEVKIDEADLAEMLADRSENIDKPAQLTIGGERFQALVRLHGGSSRAFRKTSFRFQLEDGRLEDGSDDVVVRAEFADKTMLRNYLGAEVFRYATRLPATRMRMVHMRINDAYYGVMWHVERVDSVYLRARGLFPASMYEADPPFEYSIPGGNLTPLPTLAIYQAVYDQKSGEAFHADLIALIEDLLDLPYEQFIEKVEDEMDVDWCLRYLAIMAVLQNQDHVRKNYYLYRDTATTRYSRWMIFPWDLDLAMGHLWTEENDVLDESIFTDASPYVGKRVPEHTFYNQLMTQLWTSPEYDKVFWKHIRAALQSTFTPEFIDDRIDAALCRGTPDILADKKKRAHNSEYMDRVQEVRDFVAARREFLMRTDPYGP